MVHALPTRRRFIAALVTLPAWSLLPEAHAEPALLLAQTAPEGIDPKGYLISEKYDGVRALWDGRVLRFRSGLTIAAPQAFVERLPAVQLDGELWLARGRFEQLSGLWCADSLPMQRPGGSCATWCSNCPARVAVLRHARRASRSWRITAHGRNCRP